MGNHAQDGDSLADPGGVLPARAPPPQWTWYEVLHLLAAKNPSVHFGNINLHT